MTPRAPVLYPRPIHRGSSNAARLSRVCARDDGTLVYRDARGQEAVLAEPGAVRRARLLPDQTLVLEVPPGRPIALPLRSWTPGWPDMQVDHLEVSGARALLDRIGVDSWDLDAETHTAGRLRLVSPERAGWRSWWRPLFALQVTAISAVWVWVVAGIVRAVQGGPRPIPPAWAVTLVALAFAAIAIWDQLRARAVNHRASSAPVDAVAVFNPEPAGKVPEGFASNARLWTTTEGDIAIVDARGREARLPGPTRGGVVEALALVPKGGRPLNVNLADGAGTTLAELPGSVWAGRGGAADRLAAVLDSAGVTWREQRVPRGVGFDDSAKHELGPEGLPDFPTITLRQSGHDTSSETGFYVPVSAVLLAIPAFAARAWVAVAICVAIVAAYLWLRFAARNGRRSPP